MRLRRELSRTLSRTLKLTFARIEKYEVVIGQVLSMEQSVMIKMPPSGMQAVKDEMKQVLGL